jgi:hypothetical protein
MTVKAYYDNLKNPADEQMFFFLYVSVSVSADVL